MPHRAHFTRALQIRLGPCCLSKPPLARAATKTHRIVMLENLEIFLAEQPVRLRVLGIHQASLGYLELRLLVRTDRPGDLLEIHCRNAVDFSIRPMNPAIIEGGPVIEFHTTHPRLEDYRLQYVPGGDGEQFVPPLKLKLLILDQSYVIAETFGIK
jgi:hypothetical protein